MEPKTFVNPKKGTPLLLVGTMKGAFLLSADQDRDRWDVSGPHFPGRTIYALAYDRRAGRQRLWAASSHFFGTLLHSSDDFGKTWTHPESSPVKFPEDFLECQDPPPSSVRYTPPVETAMCIRAELVGSTRTV